MEKDREYTFVNTDFSPSYREHVKKTFRWNTMPVIVKWSGIDQQLIGGYDVRHTNEDPRQIYNNYIYKQTNAQ